MTPVHIELRNRQRQRLFGVEVDLAHPPSIVKPPPADASAPVPEVHLNWDQSVDDRGYLRRCPACGCHELFVRKDFPQVTGVTLVVLAALVAMVLFGRRQVLAAWIVLATMVLVDALIYFFAGKRLVCYRCRSEFMNMPIPPDHPGWDLAIGEKYRETGGEASHPGPGR